jgi:hypothetical protein
VTGPGSVLPVLVGSVSGFVEVGLVGSGVEGSVVDVGSVGSGSPGLVLLGTGSVPVPDVEALGEPGRVDAPVVVCDTLGFVESVLDDDPGTLSPVFESPVFESLGDEHAATSRPRAMQPSPRKAPLSAVRVSPMFMCCVLGAMLDPLLDIPGGYASQNAGATCSGCRAGRLDALAGASQIRTARGRCGFRFPWVPHRERLRASPP